MMFRLSALTVVSALCVGTAPVRAGARMTGELKTWHRVTVSFRGPTCGEERTPNPFRDYRLTVTFRKGERRVVVPGFFAADGKAAESGATEGDVWRAHFTPDEEGQWTYVASFRAGKDVAIDPGRDAGKPTAFDGAKGSFVVKSTDKTGRDHRAKGMLRYVGEHYLQFAETKDYFIKGGADSPENFLGYADFDGTYKHVKGKQRRGEALAKGLHQYQPHVRDWRPGDPVWRGGKGKGIIGALNYLAGKGMNSVYFLTMNVGGDGKDVWPWTRHAERFRFDCSKLGQWEIVLSHMDRLGIQLHVITQETENDQLLDRGDLGPERKLYYRELVARFAHHLAVTWNLGEENTNTDAQRKAFAKFIRDLDPYDHPIVCHTYPGRYDRIYTPLLGFRHFEGPSLQTNDTHRQTLRWVDRSAAADRKWIVCLDEIGPANAGVKPDSHDPTHDEVRKRHLWGNLMAGGAGCEWYFGYRFPHNDLNCEDWRSRDTMWDQTRHALDFFHTHLPFHEMHHADHLTDNPRDYCFAKPGYVYAIYLPDGGTTRLNLGALAHPFSVLWYNPRTGGPLQNGSRKMIHGPGLVDIGQPPAEPNKDWLALLKLPPGVRVHLLTVKGGSGTGGYPAGAAVPIAAAEPPDGRAFDRWHATNAKVADPASPTTTVTMPAAGATVEAVYRQGPKGAAIVGFTLINADTDQPIGALEDGAILDLARLPTRNLNIRADVSGRGIAAVRFGLDGQRNFRTERAAPYALAGDTGGNYSAWTPAPGQHRLTAVPITRRGATGTALTVTFTVK